MAKISVIIPCYNVALYLKKALDSVINQTLKDIEIICIDDCSTDNSLEILQEYEEKDDRIKIIVQIENQGQGVARNMAINFAVSDYIMFLDPDDWYELNACEKAYNQISKNNNDVVFFSYKEHYQDGKIKSNFCYDKSLVGKKMLNKYEDDIPYSSFSVIKIYNKDFLIKNECKFSETRGGEDIPFAAKVISHANSISVMEDRLYNYVILDAKKSLYRKNVIASRINNFYEDFENKKMAYDIVVNCENSGNFLKSFVLYYIRTLQLHSYDFFTAKDKTLKKKAFGYIHQYFSEIDSNLIKTIKDDIYDYARFKRFIECNDLKDFEFKDFLAKIFSVSHTKGHNIIYILGVKIKYKKDK